MRSGEKLKKPLPIFGRAERCEAPRRPEILLLKYLGFAALISPEEVCEFSRRPLIRTVLMGKPYCTAVWMSTKWQEQIGEDFFTGANGENGEDNEGLSLSAYFPPVPPFPSVKFLFLLGRDQKGKRACCSGPTESRP